MLTIYIENILESSSLSLFLELTGTTRWWGVYVEIVLSTPGHDSREDETRNPPVVDVADGRVAVGAVFRRTKMVGHDLTRFPLNF